MTDRSLQSLIRSFYEFDRSVARLTNALWTSEPDLPCTIAEGRVICGLGDGESVELRDLRRILSIDAGFLSRLVKRLEERQLLTRGRSAGDARRQAVRLTDSGQAVQRILAEHFEDRLKAVLQLMDDSERDRFLTATEVICAVVDNHL